MGNKAKHAANGFWIDAAVVLLIAVAIHISTFFILSFLAWDFTYITLEGHRWTFFGSWLIAVYLANRDLIKEWFDDD